MTKIIRKKRKFVANKKTNLTVTSVGRIKLRKNEHFSINFMDKVNDVCAMSWGLYATSSINKRLKKQGCITYLTQNASKKKFIMIVHKNKKMNFQSYCKREKIKVIKIIK
jgi:hypothetical protein|tara:strand:+ start:340 stop:669 length:330 start_codon:yes stop_codon:yes gene_type:complete